MTERLWEDLSRRLRTSAPYERLVAELGDVVRLPVAGAGWLGELLRRDLEERSARSAMADPLTLLVVVPRESDALGWMEGSRLVGGEPVFFPAPPLTPYQEASASLHVRARESDALDCVLSGRARTVVTTPRALFRRLPERSAFERAVLEIAPDEDLDLDDLIRRLISAGYRRTDMVAEVGELALRGGILDLYSPGADGPARIELFGDTVDTIRRFDAVSQRSEERLDRVRVLPLALFPAGPDDAQLLAEVLSERAGGLAVASGEELDPELGAFLEGLRSEGEAPGWENLLPLLANSTTDLPGFLGTTLLVAVDPEALVDEAESYAVRLQTDYAHRVDAGRLAIPEPEEIDHPVSRVMEHLEGAPVRLVDLITDRRDGIDFAATTTDLFHGQLPRFNQEVATCQARGERCVVVVASEHRRRMEELLEGREIALGPGGVELVEGELERGFRLPAAGFALYGEQQLLPKVGDRSRPTKRRKSPRYGPFVSGLRDLKVGDYVVHADHGIGQFVALRTMEAEGAAAAAPLPASVAPSGDGKPDAVEVMEIAYSSGQRLLLPLARLDQLQKFSGIEGVAPKLDKLGGTSWNKTKAKVRKSLRDMAGELLKLYAARQVAKAPALEAESEMTAQFAAAFPYDETADQRDAIAAIAEDLERERPMDRLLCGDVGYGKTEVAMRAAAKAVDAGYQVAVLAPTTILADQHLETFRARFQGFPVNVEMISRFRTPAEIREIRDKVGAGTVDILIGTHRLLSRDIGFKKLALLIVDEEQRFGVAQKERLKQLKSEVHVLAMSATPVPRTLQLSLAGVRDLSVIETPPKDRMAVETAILPFNQEVIREAIEHELERGGQVYYVYNRVESIENIQTYLKETVPDLRVTVGHGQLDEQELSRRMHAFTAREYDVLLATTIIENGIDIPNVNTMIVHNAQRFGLSQLYQLRGRVGRSNQLAYCYLLVPADRVLSEPARQRLAAIREFTDLGAGFRIAARDLEIRGAGNLLGAEQSGHIAAVGIETYLKMLEDAVREMRGETVEEDAPSVAIDLPVPFSIPPDYIEDANLRMEIYQKIAAGEEGDEEILAELTDRFGQPPSSVRTLLEVAALKRLAERLRVQAISARGKKLTIRLRQDARIDVDRLIAFVSENPEASFSPSGILTLPAGPEMLETAQQTLGELAA
jgi:transcription-repair coupling factor (superfamily II helicase)